MSKLIKTRPLGVELLLGEQTVGRTDIHDEANGHFLQLCGSAEIDRRCKYEEIW